MKDRYIYPALFTFDHDGISVEFPDLPGCLTCGSDQEEAVEMARDALGLHLYGMEEDEEPIPRPSRVTTLHTEPNQAVVLVEVWMPPLREKINQRAVKKTLTVPKWLNDMAERKGVNFSQVLQNALKSVLDIKERI